MAVGNQTPQDVASEYATLSFVVQQKLAQVSTLTLVRIVRCTNDGGVSPVGFVDVQPLVNMVSGDGTAVQHKPLYSLPYVRIQGGANAVIMDPQPGDIGLAGFCSRDISAVKNSKDIANPGSFRAFSMADGVYIGGCLNGTPTQYIAFNADGVKVLSPVGITLEAPLIRFVGPVEATDTIDAAGVIHSGIDVVADTISGKTHTHGGITPGGSNSAGPNP